jgi:hypothetical protein
MSRLRFAAPALMHEHEEGKCPKCSWQEWETAVWAVTAYLSLILGLLAIYGGGNPY